LIVQRVPSKYSEEFRSTSMPRWMLRQTIATHAVTMYRLMCDGQWHTNESIAEGTGIAPNSATAAMRSLRSRKFGGSIVQRVHIGNGLHKYRLLPSERARIIFRNK
jgi:hypothetical protein